MPSSDLRMRLREEGVRRIDWLLDKTVFVGLEKLEPLIAQRYCATVSHSVKTLGASGGEAGGKKSGKDDKAVAPDTTNVWAVKLVSHY